MKRIAFLNWLIVLSFGSGAKNLERNLKPNIIFLMADDMGWGDLGWKVYLCHSTRVTAKKIISE